MFVVKPESLVNWLRFVGALVTPDQGTLIARLAMNSLNLVAKVDADSDTQKYIGPIEPIWTTSPSCIVKLIAADCDSTTYNLSITAAGILEIGISGSLSALIVPEVILDASKPFNVLLIDTLLDPSNVALPCTAPAIAITLEVANLVAVPALPLTEVGKAALVTVTLCPDTVTPDTYCPEVAAAPPVNEGISASVMYPLELIRAITSASLISHL